ncbi:immune inhibitor A domain-containing protein [Allostreptomyces psammosilenae]|uniref:Immune inhibitor A n=1 Tax=Allostreptomyces psammosilenae TaxID=1892865 RepID=A0A852ZYE7_9ACTN|nr:immune inhibitor A domain-containing protein [Allostreptomyces psammosilenae]NYI06250.1 immune inhibitor A [Allostreptomyces psammosilenae]
MISDRSFRRRRRGGPARAAAATTTALVAAALLLAALPSALAGDAGPGSGAGSGAVSGAGPGSGPGAAGPTGAADRKVSAVDQVDHSVPEPDGAHPHRRHDLPGPLSAQQAAYRKEALRRLLAGEATLERHGTSRSVSLGDGKFVEMAHERTDRIFAVLVEFGDRVDDETMWDPDGTGPEEPVPRYGGEPGPRHNEIPEPDRSVDNTTVWQADYDRRHYEDLYFSRAPGAQSVANYYDRQSSGRYTVSGHVTDWVRVEWNGSRYGTNRCDEADCTEPWDLVRDAVNQWAADRLAAGTTPEELRAELAGFDVWDRYDHDQDGDFGESDGYIDHLQIVHAGVGEETGGGAQGEDALWSHRWYAFGTDSGRTGPPGNLLGGTEIGDTGIWVGDYTLQPENGGLGVFAHEFGHDLGLPDLYDTSHEGENSTGFWSLMSAGSYLGDGTDDIGTAPGDLGAWEKFQLGWLDYATARAATESTHTLGPAAGPTPWHNDHPRALLVTLPTRSLTTHIADPPEGERMWWSGKGDDLSNTLTWEVDLTGIAPEDEPALTMAGWWDIEAGYDYLYPEASTDGGRTWEPLDGTVDGEPIGRDAGDHPALDGESDGWRDLVLPLDDQAGRPTLLRLRYQTDSGLSLMGFAADDVTLGTADGRVLLHDGAEDERAAQADGFRSVPGAFTEEYERYYIVENRQLVGYDQTLDVGPYHFGFRPDIQNLAEHFPYQPGVLVWLWDTSQDDNNTGVHPGEGLVLPVDAHPEPEYWVREEGGEPVVEEDALVRNRVQTRDATFGSRPTAEFTLHDGGVATFFGAREGVTVFDDHSGRYWYEENPAGSVRVPDTGTRIVVETEHPGGAYVVVRVEPSTDG